MGQLFANFGYTTLASGLSAGATSMTVASGGGAKFPTPAVAMDFFDVVIEEANPADALNPAREIVRCAARSGDSLTSLTRGLEGTTDRAWAAGDKVELRITAGELGDLSRNSVGGAILLASKLGAL